MIKMNDIDKDQDQEMNEEELNFVDDAAIASMQMFLTGKNYMSLGDGDIRKIADVSFKVAKAMLSARATFQPE
jgi:hypothetical protein